VVPAATQGVTGRWNPSDGTVMGGLPQYPLDLFLIVPTPSHIDLSQNWYHLNISYTRRCMVIATACK